MTYFNRYLPRALSGRVFVLYAATLVMFITTGLGFFLRYQFVHQVDAARRASDMLVEVVAHSVQGSAAAGDDATLRKTLDRSVQGSLFSSAAYTDAAGGTVQALTPESDQGYVPAWLVNWIAEKLPDVSRPLAVGGRDYGALRLRFNAAHLAHELWSLTFSALVVGALSLLGGLLLIRAKLGRWLGALDRLSALDRSLSTGVLDVAALGVDGAPEEIQRIVDMLSRTAMLVRDREGSRRQLNNQKFALDQHAIVTITDGDGLITYANDRFCAISGYARAELLGQDHRIINSKLHPKAFFENLWNTILQGRVWNGEICNRNKAGELYWVNATVVPMMDDAGRPDQFIAIRTDITQSKAIEESLYAAKAAAEHASRAKSQFLANMSHEIRTPLNAILGMLTLMQSTELSRRQLDYTTKTEGAARSLLALLNDILDFSKVEAGMMTLDLRPFRIDQLVHDLSVILNANLGTKNLDIVFDLDPQLPRGLVGDDLRLKQVLINLGGNAIKFTSEGSVVVRIRMMERTAQDLLLEFVVQDTGIGIAPEHQKHIFNGFSQAESSTTRRFGGTGLGLAISQRLVVLMGGDLQLRSAPGRGSAFSFQARFAVAKTLADVSVSGFMGLDQPEKPKAKRLAGLRILLVEDNPINQQVACELLANEGADMSLADNGQLGVMAVASATEPFDAVLMDVQMPVMDGYAATAKIRNELGQRSLPIIAMTANAMASDREACLAAGMNDHVGKPFDLSDLVATLLRHTEGAQTSTPVREPAPPEPVGPSAQLLLEAAQRSIDLRTALGRLGGNTGVYLRLVDAFLEDLPQLPDRLCALLAQGDGNEAMRLMHTFKGLAATLGATQLQNFAAGAEQRVRATEKGSQTDALVTGLRVAVDASIKNLNFVRQQLQAHAGDAVA